VQGHKERDDELKLDAWKTYYRQLMISAAHKIKEAAYFASNQHLDFDWLNFQLFLNFNLKGKPDGTSSIYIIFA
jgi:hypothetical protein